MDEKPVGSGLSLEHVTDRIFRHATHEYGLISGSLALLDLDRPPRTTQSPGDELTKRLVGCAINWRSVELDEQFPVRDTV